ncbi:hypothetical protein GW17_00061650 [Ensete ventricosum]|nr:hypothetical protein GW17_00061650 [Ensete ventricosum]
MRAAGCNQGPPTRGRPAAARPPARGGRPQGQQPIRGGANREATCGQKHCPLPAASPQGATCPRRGRRGSAYPWPARRGAAPIEAQPAGKGSRRLRRGSGDDDAKGEYGAQREHGGDSVTHDTVAGDYDAW